MSDTINVVAARVLDRSLWSIALEPPVWVRLEPQSVSGDPTPGLEARIHDPLWLLLRQWQFGEFWGHDGGTPLGTQATITTLPLSAWAPGTPKAGTPIDARPIQSGDSIEAAVEREPPSAAGPSWWQRLEAGALLVEMLAEAGFDGRAALLASCALEFPAPAAGADTPAVPAAIRLAASGQPDGASAAAQLETAGPDGPGWVDGAGPNALAAAEVWRAWYRTQVSPPLANTSESWTRDRLEYRFALRAGAGSDQVVFSAPAHDGGAIDWHTFDHVRGAQLAVVGEAAAAPQQRQVQVMASPLRYAGMPADRLWEFEDGLVNVGQMEIQAHDLARLCLVEFATIYGSDWFVAPADEPVGSFSTIQELAYTTTFDERIVVPPANDAGRQGRFRLFQISESNSTDSLTGLFVPQSGSGVQEGRPLEDVLLARDEAANMAWAIETLVQDASGEPRNRDDEPELAIAEVDPSDMLRYLLETSVRRNWIPLVPVPLTGQGGFVLKKGTMTGADESRGVFLDPTPLTIQEEEIPREGVRVRRVPALARTTTGATVRWISRRVTIGRGGASSNLAFDSLIAPTGGQNP